MTFDTSNRNLDRIFNYVNKYLGESGLENRLNPDGIIGAITNKTRGEFTAQSWVSGITQDITKSAIAVMIHYGDEQSGYNFLDRVVQYVTDNIPVLATGDLKRVEAAVDERISDSVAWAVGGQALLKVLEEKEFIKSLKPVYTTLFVLGLFSNTRDYTTREKIEHLLKTKPEDGTYKFMLENLAEGYKNAIGLLGEIQPSRIRQFR